VLQDAARIVASEQTTNIDKHTDRQIATHKHICTRSRARRVGAEQASVMDRCTQAFSRQTVAYTQTDRMICTGPDRQSVRGVLSAGTRQTVRETETDVH